MGGLWVGVAFLALLWFLASRMFREGIMDAEDTRGPASHTRGAVSGNRNSLAL